MRNTAEIRLLTDKTDGEAARRLIEQIARKRSLRVRVKTVRGRQLRQLEFVDTSVAVVISVLGGVVAPTIIDFISQLKSRLRRIRHSLGISAHLAEQIGAEVITRYTKPGLKARLISVQELGEGRGFRLLFRQREKTYTLRLNQYGELESCVRR
jgi:hypothetical protein